MANAADASGSGRAYNCLPKDIIPSSIALLIPLEFFSHVVTPGVRIYTRSSSRFRLLQMFGDRRSDHFSGIEEKGYRIGTTVRPERLWNSR